MQDNAKNCGKDICGDQEILCDAKHCSYIQVGNYCTADHIKVSGQRAECTGETCCDTFKPRCC